MKKLLYILLIAITLPSIANATTFRSDQVGSSPVAGYILQTDGTNSTWVVNSGGGGGGGGTYPFTPATNYGVNNQATTGIAWFQNGLNASSTSNLVYASTTALTVSGTAFLPGSSAWTSSGLVGIGTVNPTYKFQIGTSASTVYGNTVYDSLVFDTTYAYNGWRGGSVETFMGADNSSGQGDFGVATNHPLRIYTNNSIKASILTNGNFGIGTTTPGSVLSVHGVANFADINSRIYSKLFAPSYVATSTTVASIFPYASTTVLSADTLCLTGDTCRTTWPTSGSGGGVGWATSSADTTSIYSTAPGNVGIGTTSPYSKLSVAGTIVGRNFVGTTTTATSTLAGSLTVGWGAPYAYQLIATSTDVLPKYGQLRQTLIDAGGSINDYMSINVYNNSTSPCASADFTANNDLADITTDFIDIGRTGSGWTGVGCSSALTGVPANSGYIFDPTGSISNLLGDSTKYFAWFKGYGVADRIMTLLGNGNLGVGTSSPYERLSVAGKVVAQTFNATSTTLASIFPYASTTAITSSGSAYFATSVGRVGIGTVNPKYPLDVAGTINSQVTGAVAQFTAYNPLTNYPRAQFLIGNSASDVNTGMIISPLYTSAGVQKSNVLTVSTNKDATDSGAYSAGVILDTTKATIYTANRDNYTGAGTGIPISFTIYNSNVALEALKIATDGKIGIGTTTPGQRLSVGGDILGNTIIGSNFNATSTTATSTIRGGLDLRNATVQEHLYPSFVYATSTAWTGTTTVPLGPAFILETWQGIKCFTDVGTVNVSIYDGTNRMNMFNASTTIGIVALNTNNQFVASEKRYIDIGTPASSPTSLSCTVDKIINQ